MSPTPDGRTTRHLHRRPQLLAALTEYVLEHGLADFSLRPAAGALGVTHSTLIRHFGSRERLLEEVIEVVCDDLLRQVDSEIDDPEAPTSEVLRAVWAVVRRPREQRQFALLFELAAAKARGVQVTDATVHALVTGLLEPLERNLRHHGAEPSEARELATLVAAQLRGLQLDLALSKDETRIDAAMARFIEAFPRLGSSSR